MRRLTLITAYLIAPALALAASPSAEARRLTGGGDICAVRPDLCDRPGRAAKPTAVKTARVRRAITCRPASVEVTANNQNLPECGGGRGRSIASVNDHQLSLSFGAYMNQNAANPALSRKSITNYQTAFAATAKPATLDVTGLIDNSGVRETAPVAPAASATPRNNQ